MRATSPSRERRSLFAALSMMRYLHISDIVLLTWQTLHGQSLAEIYLLELQIWFYKLDVIYLTILSGLIVMGLTAVAIPDIEKEFRLSSTDSGLILASNDIAGILLVPIVAFFGQDGKKPKWLGCGALITGMLCSYAMYSYQTE